MILASTKRDMLPAMIGVVAVVLGSFLQAQPPSPAGAPEQWLLAFVDVEKTGLTPGYHEMIDVGIYYYFILDVPSMAWSLGIRGLDGPSLARELGVEDEPHVAEEHTGITGAALNARIYRALLQHRTGTSLMLTPQTSGTDARLQAVSVVSDDVAWVSGLAGTFGRTTDGGKTWHIGVVDGAEDLQFRDLHAVSPEVAYLLSAGPGAQSRIYRTVDGGASWVLTFANEEPEGFFDCMDFWDASHGLAYGDSVRGELVVIATEDGETWRPVPPEALPRARDGEGGFAASGTCVLTQGDSIAYIATGAGSARILRTSDRGESWDSFETPVVSDSETSGLTSVAFTRAGEGIAVGGDISLPDAPQPNVAVTSDGGGSWSLATSPFPGPIYGVAYVPGTSPRPVFVAVGPRGAAYTRDGAATWVSLSEESFWAVGFGPSGRGYMVGPDGRITRVDVP